MQKKNKTSVTSSSKLSENLSKKVFDSFSFSVFSVFSVFLVFLLFSSCANQERSGKTQAENLYKDAKDLYKDGQYTLANQKLNQIKAKYSYSIFASKAELMTADILYKQESFVEAASSYLMFKNLYPQHKKMDYVSFQIANSFFMQKPSTYDRDLTPCNSAIQYYNDFLAKYPFSKHKTMALLNKAICFKMLENKEKYIADFYFKTKSYRAAILRYLKIVNYSANDKLLKHSFKRIMLAYSKHENNSQYSKNIKTIKGIKKDKVNKYKKCEKFKKKFRNKILALNLTKLFKQFNCSKIK